MANNINLSTVNIIKNPIEIDGLVAVNSQDVDAIFDIRYASNNNICNTKLYSSPFFYLNYECLQMLKKAISVAKRIGLKIKIFDGYRPIAVQKYMFDKFINNSGFVSNPDGGVVSHCRGVAIDLTLTNIDGIELDMGSDFDEFSNISYHNSELISSDALKNRLLLLGLMSSCGFDFYQKEWWHYQLFKPRDYPIIIGDACLSAF